MSRLVLTAALAFLVLGSCLFAEEAQVLKFDKGTGKLVVKLLQRNQQVTVDLSEVTMKNPAGNEVTPQYLKRLREGARIDARVRDGKVTEIRLSGSKD